MIKDADSAGKSPTRPWMPGHSTVAKPAGRRSSKSRARYRHRSAQSSEALKERDETLGIVTAAFAANSLWSMHCCALLLIAKARRPDRKPATGCAHAANSALINRRSVHYRVHVAFRCVQPRRRPCDGKGKPPLQTPRQSPRTRLKWRTRSVALIAAAAISEVAAVSSQDLVPHDMIASTFGQKSSPVSPNSPQQNCSAATCNQPRRFSCVACRA